MALYSNQKHKGGSLCIKIRLLTILALIDAQLAMQSHICTIVYDSAAISISIDLTF